MNDNPYRPRLVFVGEPFAGRVFELTKEKFTVGRSEQNNLALRHSTVSQRHCEILVFGPEVLLHDLDSRNGTFVQEVRIHSQMQLKHGQTVRFGDVSARLELVTPELEQTISDETAVHVHAQVLRDHRRKQASPVHEAGTPASDASPLSDGLLSEQTVAMPRVASPAVKIAPPIQPAAEPTGRVSRAWLVAMLLALVSIGLGVLLWLLLRK